MDTSEARQRLRDERSRLERLREEAGEGLAQEQDAGQAELTPLDQHPADAATNLHDREVGQSVVGGLDTGIAEIDEALHRLDAGTYGHCQDCGEPIPDERLEAVPATRYCTVHQALQEGADRAGSESG